MKTSNELYENIAVSNLSSLIDLLQKMSEMKTEQELLYQPLVQLKWIADFHYVQLITMEGKQLAAKTLIGTDKSTIHLNTIIHADSDFFSKFIDSKRTSIRLKTDQVKFLSPVEDAFYQGDVNEIYIVNQLNTTKLRHAFIFGTRCKSGFTSGDINILSAYSRFLAATWLNLLNEQSLVKNNQTISKQSTRQKRLNEIIKQSLKQTREAKQAAEKANKSKSIFIANMSHEVRTPMNAILGFSSILKRTYSDSKALQYVDYIINSGENLMHIINDILDLSKIEAGKIEIDYRPSSITEILTSIRNLFSIDLEKKQLNLIIDIDPDLPCYLLFDSLRMNQIIVNILSNAIKFTDSGYIKICVFSLNNSTVDNAIDLAISVEDTGKGIPRDQFESVFSSFEQVRGQRESVYGGTGLGMAICKKLVELMDGEISLESEVDIGSTFHLMFRNFEIAKEHAEETKEKFNAQDYIFDAKNIIYLRHNELQEQIITGYLNAFPFNITVVDTIDELNSSFEHLKIDLVICDTKDEQLYSLLFNICNLEQYQSIPIIKLTTSISNEALKFNEKINCFITKPFYQEELILSIAQCLPCTILQPPSKINGVVIDTSFGLKELQFLPQTLMSKLLIYLFDDKPHERLDYLLTSGDIEAISELGEKINSFGIDTMEPAMTMLGDYITTQANDFNLADIESTLLFFIDKSKAIEEG